MPQTSKDYNTTLPVPSRNDTDEKTKEPLFKSDEEYEDFVKKFNEAKELQEREYGVVGWYDWGLKYLGTKWNAEIDDMRIEKHGEEIRITMCCVTAWKAPEAWMVHLLKYFTFSKFVFHATEELVVEVEVHRVAGHK